MAIELSSVSSPQINAGVRPPPTSGWAVASLLCSLGLCCPATPLVGVLLGLRALMQIKSNPMMRGRNVAIAGIVIGLLGAAGWIGSAVWWHYNARIPMLYGPREELRAGFAGDIAALKSGFHGDGAAAPDAEASAFLNQLSMRYGRFIDAAQSPIATTTATMDGPTEYRIAYTLRFDQAHVEAEAVFITFAPAQIVPQPVFKWKWLRVIDPQRGDLVYPVSATNQATAQPQAAVP